MTDSYFKQRNKQKQKKTKKTFYSTETRRKGSLALLVIEEFKGYFQTKSLIIRFYFDLIRKPVLTRLVPLSAVILNGLTFRNYITINYLFK